MNSSKSARDRFSRGSTKDTLQFLHDIKQTTKQLEAMLADRDHIHASTLICLDEGFALFLSFNCCSSPCALMLVCLCLCVNVHGPSREIGRTTCAMRTVNRLPPCFSTIVFPLFFLLCAIPSLLFMCMKPTLPVQRAYHHQCSAGF